MCSVRRRERELGRVQRLIELESAEAQIRAVTHRVSDRQRGDIIRLAIDSCFDSLATIFRRERHVRKAVGVRCRNRFGFEIALYLAGPYQKCSSGLATEGLSQRRL